MAFDWLYGPRVYEYSKSFFRIRSLAIDHDTLRDVYGFADEAFGDAQLIVSGIGPLAGPEELFDIERLDVASDLEVSRLVLRAPRDAPKLQIDFRRHSEPVVGAQPMFAPAMEDPAELEALHKIVEHLNGNGRPRVRLDLIYRLPLLLPLALLACWVWFVVSQSAPVSLIPRGLALGDNQRPRNLRLAGARPQSVRRPSVRGASDTSCLAAGGLDGACGSAGGPQGGSCHDPGRGDHRNPDNAPVQLVLKPSRMTKAAPPSEEDGALRSCCVLPVS